MTHFVKLVERHLWPVADYPREIYFNPDNVSVVDPIDEHSTTLWAGSQKYTVKGSAEEILRQLQATAL